MLPATATGVRHSEYNLENETTTLFQNWIIPRSAGGSPSWGAKPFPKDDRSGKFMVLASGYEADEGALKIGADARVLAATLTAGESLTYDTGQGKIGRASCRERVCQSVKIPVEAV